MKKIIVFGVNFSEEQKARLNALGEVSYVSSPENSEELISKAKGFDVVCSDGSCLFDSLPKLNNVFVTYPYIELGPFNSEELKKNGVLVANTQEVAGKQLPSGLCLRFCRFSVSLFL